MRNVLVLAAVGVATLVACSDAGHNDPRLRAGAYAAGDPADPGETVNAPSDPTATAAPPPPATPGTAASGFAATLDNVTPQADLADEVVLTATIAPKDGFVGQVMLAVTGLPANVTADVSPANLTLNTTPAIAKVTLKVAAGADASAAAGVPIVLTATSGQSTATANANFKVNNVITMHIPMNVDALNKAGAQASAYGAAFTGSATAPVFKTGLQVKVFNDDSVAHVVHGQTGFQHGDTTAGNVIKPNAFEVANGATKVRTLTAGTTPNGYLHTETDGAGTTIDPSGINAPFKFNLKN